MGFRGGYVDWPITRGAHHIEVKGNAFTSTTVLRYYFHQRATELCSEEGFNGYRMASQDTEVQTYRTQEAYRTETDCSIYRNSASCSSDTYPTGGLTYQRGTVVGEVVCMRPP